MDNLKPEILEYYKHWEKKVGQEEPYTGEGIVGIHEVLRAHFLISDYFASKNNPVGLIGPKDLNMLHSALNRQFVSFGGIDKWEQKTEKIATLFYGLIKNHPFHDGNKRTALLIAIHQMHKMKLTPTANQSSLEKITINVAENTLKLYPRFRDYQKKGKRDAEVHFLAYWFKKNSRQLDKRYYAITYNDLNTILKGFGFELENPRHNHIDIMKYETSTGIFGKKEISRRIGQIGFPSWSSKVGKGAINTVRKTTGLIPENGYDSQTFFRGIDGMTVLIREYSRLLQRLKDK